MTMSIGDVNAGTSVNFRNNLTQVNDVSGRESSMNPARATENETATFVEERNSEAVDTSKGLASFNNSKDPIYFNKSGHKSLDQSLHLSRMEAIAEDLDEVNQESVVKQPEEKEEIMKQFRQRTAIKYSHVIFADVSPIKIK